MIEQPENQNNVLTSSVSQNPVASELDGDSIDSAVQNALTENALNQNKKTQILTPVQQLTPIENAVNETIKRNNESNKTALNQSLVSASAKDPDTVAKSQALAASLNVSTGVVDFDIELAKRQKLLRQAEVMKLVEKYPSLARRFLDKEFAEVAHDDMDNLAKTADLANELRGNLPVGMGSGDKTLFGETATKYASEMFTDFERGMISGTNTTTYGELAYRAQIPVLTIKDFAYAPQRSILEQRPDLEQAIQYAESVVSGQEEYRGTWSESFGTIIGQMSSMMVEASAVGTAFGGAAAIAGQLGPQIALPEEVITVPAAVSLGFTTSLIDQTRRVETGSAFVEYYRGSEDYEPLPYEEAAWAANIVGTINASIELASTAFFFVPLAGALPKAFLKKSIVNAFRKAITKSGAIRAAATHLVKSTATEIGTEVVQEGTIVVAREITGVLTEPNFQSALSTQEGRDRLEERFSSIFEVTLKGTVPLAFITGGFGLAHQMRNIARSQKLQKLITDQIATKVESKVNKRSKTTYASYLAEQLSGESLHIGVEKFEQARRKNGVGLQEVEKIIPGITEQVAKAKASGGDVVIPTSLYLSELIDTEFGVSIRNDIRADAEGMSINEIAESQEFLKELKSINKQAIEDFKKTNKDWAESAGKIEEEVFAKIKAAGNYTEEEARMLAQWHRDTAVVLASRFGMTPEQFNAKFGLSIESAYTPEQQAPAQQVAPTINELEKFLTVEDRQELSNLEKQRTEDDGGTLSDRSKLAIQDRKSDLIQQRKLEQDRPEVMKSLLEENAGKESDITSMVRRLLGATAGAVGNIAVAFDKGLISDLELLVIIKRLEAITDKESSAEFRKWAYSHKNKEIGKAFGELPMADEMNEHPKTASQLIAKLIPETIAQNKLDREAQAKAREAKQAPAQGSFEQASRADLGLGQQAAPAPDIGVFDANNPPVSSEAIFALMDADGKIYYDINATMHGDLVETFPDITDTVIDGGFIVNGKYMMGKSDGGYSAFEGEQKQIDAVRNFTEQANTQGFQESNYRPAVVAWAKEKFGDRTAPDGSTVWQNFTEWFGDSKVVDAEGKPMVVYHATSAKTDFVQFKAGDVGLFGTGIYFSTNLESTNRLVQGNYGGQRIIPSFLSIKNPLKVTQDSFVEDMLNAINLTSQDIDIRTEEIRKRNVLPDTASPRALAYTELLQEAGFDGVEVQFRNINNDGVREGPVVESYFVAFEPTQIKSAIANTGEFSATDPNMLRQELSTRRPSGKLATENPITTLLTISHDQTLRTPEVLEKNIATLRRLTPMKWLDDSATPEQQLEYFIEQGVANLEFLYELMPNELRQRARLWYDGGRKMAEWMSDRTGLSVMQSAGVLAVLSPQKDWYENVTLAHRISDIISTQLDFAWDDKMTETSDRFIETIKEAKRKAAEKKKASGKEEDPNSEDSIAMDLLTSLRGKKLSEIINNPMSAAVWVRVFDETHNNKSYSIILPEGGIGETRVTAEGSPSKLRWQNYGAVSRAISIIIDGRAENVFYQIGGQHKVRNFYNNLFAPESDLYATIDTHAVAAALMQPFAGTDEAVGHAFGGSPSSGITGLSGAYSIYMEVYRRAAEKYGILPREMQSITWEAVRGLFEAADKKTLKPKVNAIWDRYKRGEIDANQARSEVISIAGGITEPSWAKTSFDDSPAITYSGKSATDTITKLVAEKTSDAVDVLFEVAPDPTNIALSAQWNSLDAQTKHRISAEVAAEIVPNILKEFGVSGEVVAQVGGWEGKTNPGFALRVTSGKLTGQIARALGRTLSQQGMYSISAKPFLGSEVSGVVVITLPAGYTEKQIADLYEKLWKLKRNRKPIIQGHSTIDGKMVIINGTKIATTDFADMIDKHLGGAFEVTDTEAHTAFDSKDTYDTNLQRPASKGSTVLGSERLDRFREQATSLIDTKINEAKSASGLLAQSAQNKPARGWFNPKQLKMMLGSKSDFTTFIHELAHYNLTVLGRIASDPQSPSQIREDMDTTLSWFGIAGETPEQRLANWNAMTLEEQRRHHEAFAYNHEIYLSEGKSPSIEMQGVFERFSQFVKRIYISIRDDLNAIYKQEFGTDLPMMTGEIRRVMDRMIATDEQIRSAEERRNMEDTFRDQELSGMDDAQWASYQQMRAEATQKSVSELNEQSLAATTWASRLKAKKVKEIEAEQEELRSEIRKQVKKEVESRNVYRAIKFLKYGILQTAGGEEVEFTGSNKLNTNAVKLMVPKENMDKFGSGKNGMVALDGYHPDIVSERFNYSSGDELILAILDAKPMDEVIDGITEDRMEIENGELNSPQAIEAAADKAVHNEARVKLVAVELRWLTKATQPVRAMIAAAKSVAKQMLETKRLRDIKPGDYASAAARAAKESQTAYFASQSAETAAKTAYTRHYNKMIAEGAEEAKAVEMATKVSDEALAKAESRSEAHKKKYGKMKPSEVAAQSKRSQLLQEQLALEANEALDQVKKSIKYLRNVLSDKNVQKIGADNSDQIALLLERFELKNISLKEMDKRTSLANWIASQLELGLEVDISKELIEQTNKISYRNLTLSEFNDLVDAVKTIEYMGKNENAVLTAAKKAAFKETRDEIVKSIIENAGDRKASTRTPKSGTIDAVIYPIKRFIAAQFKAASIVRILDGGKDDGPLWNYLIRSANKSGDKETTMRATATEAVSKILAPFFKSGRMGGKGKMFNSVNESLNREEKLVIALNMGNEGNIQRMLDGYGWTLEQVIPILESMTTEELNAVQEIWDHFETYKNEISVMSRKIFGKDLDFVEPTPIQIKSASGEIVSLRGGYYPAKYDPIASSKAQNLDEAEIAKQPLKAAYISATTSRGYSKQRAAKVVGQPLIRNLSALYSGLNEVIHDLSWREWTIDANKLMRDNAFDKEIRNRYGSLFTDQLKSWIQDVAAGDKAMDTGMDIPLNFLRQGISSAGLGFNLTSAALQVTGFNQSIIRVGPKYIGYGIMQVMKRGTGAFQEVNELSDFMANRSRTQFRELNELRNRIRGQSAVMKKVRMGTYFLMMKMQRSVDVPTWIGAYAKQLEINPDEQLAIDIADQTVIDTQGGGQIKDLSGVERGGAGAKLFTVFYGYMNTVYNMAAVETMTEKKRGKLAAKYVMLFVVPVVLSYALKQLLKPSKDDDDEFDLEQMAKDLSIEQIEYLMGTMVVAREFSQIARTMIDPSAPSMGYSGPAGLRTIKDTYTAATQFGQGEFDSAFRKSAINLIGDISGLPSAQVNRTIDGIEALMEDETTDIRAPLFGVRK